MTQQFHFWHLSEENENANLKKKYMYSLFKKFFFNTYLTFH